MELNLITLNIIACAVFGIISLGIFSVVLNEMKKKFDFKISTYLMITFWGVVGIMNFFLIIASFPFDIFKTIHQTQYTSFTVSGLSDGTTTVTVKDKKNKEESYKFDEDGKIKDSSFKEFQFGTLNNKTSTNISQLGQGDNKEQKYLFTVKDVEINNFPIVNFIKLFVKLDGKEFQSIKTKTFEISEVHSKNPTVKYQYEQK